MDWLLLDQLFEILLLLLPVDLPAVSLVVIGFFQSTNFEEMTWNFRSFIRRLPLVFLDSLPILIHFLLFCLKLSFVSIHLQLKLLSLSGELIFLCVELLIYSEVVFSELHVFLEQNFGIVVWLLLSCLETLDILFQLLSLPFFIFDKILLLCLDRHYSIFIAVDALIILLVLVSLLPLYSFYLFAPHI